MKIRSLTTSLLVVISILSTACSKKDDSLTEKETTVSDFIKDKSAIIGKYNVINFNDVVIDLAGPEYIAEKTWQIRDRNSKDNSSVVIHVVKADYDKYSKEAQDASDKHFNISCKTMNLETRVLDGYDCTASAIDIKK